jgi:hypothetical protein
LQFGSVRYGLNKPLAVPKVTGMSVVSASSMAEEAQPKRSNLGAVLCAAVALGGGWRGEARDAAPMSFHEATFIGPHFFAAFLPQHATQWVRIEMSDDLQSWQEAAHALTTQAHLYADSNAKTGTHRYFRLVAPGTSPGQARDRWLARAPGSYRFRFTTIPNAKAWTGEVTVRNGQKTITELRDLYTSAPVTDANPAEIPDVAELFAMVEERTAPGELANCRVVYDPEWGYPAEATFFLNFPEAFRSFQITEFEALPD